MADTIQINEAQSKAIMHGAGPMLVLAGPGSGKTFVITRRIQYLIEQHHVSPEQILVITFTKAAAGEMQERFVKLTSNECYPVTFGTFHAFFFQILKQAYHFNTSNIIRESEKRKYLSEIIHHIPQEIQNDVCVINSQTDAEHGLENSDADNQDILQRILAEIGKVKNMGIALSDFESSVCSKAVFAFLYEEYEQAKHRKRKVDFDDMVFLCQSLLQKRKDILQLWQKRFPYILIDEFQDISPAQYQIVKLLAKPYNNLFVVGDDDQAIYGFRGSSPKIMLGFMTDFPDASQVLLNRNYRSKSDIVQYSANLVSHNKNRFPKQIEAQNTRTDGVKMFAFSTHEEQSWNIIQLIKQYMQQPQACLSDIALIYRTNTNAVIMAEKLIQENIPVKIQEKQNNLYESEVAKDILAYIRFALVEKDVKSFYRIMNRPSRYIRRDSVPARAFTMQELIQNNYGKDNVIQNVISFYRNLRFLKEMSPFAAVNFIRKGIGYEDYLWEKAKETGLSVKTQLQELDKLQEQANQFNTLQEWIFYIDHNAGNLEKTYTKEEDAVHIVTMHAAKGLEWKVVILPDVNEGIIPHKKAVSPEEIEEERRMFYVAMTRAKEQLFLFYIKEKTGGNLLPSRFIPELHCHAASDSKSP